MGQALGHGRLSKEVTGLLLQQPKHAGVQQVRKVALALWRGIATPFSRSLEAALLAGDIDTIARAYVDPRNYASVDEYYVDACAAAFLSKFEALGEMGNTTIDPRAAAVAAFFQTELQCKDTNSRLQQYVDGLVSPTNPKVSDVIAEAKGLISSMLPRVPRPRTMEIKFGPGATSQCSGESTTLADKLAAYPELTVGSRHFVSAVQSCGSWLRLLSATHPGSLYNAVWVTDDYGDRILVSSCIAPKLVRGNRFTTVPKNAKTDRGICIEPHTLSCLQLAVGTILTDTLRKLGIQKDLAKDVHARMACDASLTGECCTVDLKAASDTISWEVVKLLLPEAWFEFLASLRCDETEVDGEWVFLEKFSSMGNGFTFELETLIFYALSRSVANLCGFNNVAVSVFGDDIIIPTGAYKLLQEVLNFLGFTVNREKTFVAEGFNESCGADFWAGRPVRPYYLKEDPRYVSSWYGVCNGLHAAAERLDGVFDVRFRRAWLTALGFIPVQFRFHGPASLGNAVIHDSDRSRWTLRPIYDRDESVVPVEVGHRPVLVKTGRFEVRGLKPRVPERSLTRWCNATIYTALLYATSRGGDFRCRDGSIALRGDPIKDVVHWYPTFE